MLNAYEYKYKEISNYLWNKGDHFMHLQIL